VERRDLGISGTKGWEERPDLAALIQAIEADEVEAVYVVHISRISRDQTLIDGLEFGELCKQHRVLIVMPTMRLNLRDSIGYGPRRPGPSATRNCVPSFPAARGMPSKRSGGCWG
jgi:Resolvase, N terminal domain